MSVGYGASADSGIVLANEFASVRVSVDNRGHSPRLLVQDLISGGSILLEPLELASFCLARGEDRERWLMVGEYRGGASPSPVDREAPAP
jgi:hypothetical protein